MRCLAVLAFAVLALAPAAGCSDDDFGQERPPSDLGAQQYDQAGVDLAADLATAAVMDLATPKPPDGPKYTCSDAFTCNNACGTDKVCGDACAANINTTSGPTRYSALQTCFVAKVGGVCAGVCSPVSVDCTSCLFTNCQAEWIACQTDM